MTPVRPFFVRALGTWRGSESFLADDGGEHSAEGEIRYTLGLGGRGLIGHYHQTADGAVVMRNISVLNAAADGQATLDWLPERGEAQRFAGRVEGEVVTLERSGEHGLMRLVSDYSAPNTITTTMTVTTPDGPLTLFEGAYERVGLGAQVFRVLLPVGDIDRAIAFYSAVLQTPAHRASPGRAYFECGSVILACFDAKADGDSVPSTPLSEVTYLSVADVERARAAWKAAGGTFPPDGREFGQEIVVRPWGERSFYALDPFGNTVAFIERGTEYRGT